MSADETARDPAQDRWPFDDWLRLAVTRFGLSPTEFWTLSLTDWFALNRPHHAPPLTRKTFADLQAAYPDEPGNNSCAQGELHDLTR